MILPVEQTKEITHFNEPPPFVPPSSKGLGDVSDSLSSKTSANVLFDIGDLFQQTEKTHLEFFRGRSTEIERLSQKKNEQENEMARQKADIDKWKKYAPNWEAAKKIVSGFSTSAAMVTGFELIAAGSPIAAGIFLTSAVLSTANLSGFFQEYKNALDKLSFATGVAAIGTGYFTKTLTDNAGKIVTAATSLLNGVVSAGASFHKRSYELTQELYHKTHEARLTIEHSLSSLMRAVEQSFEEQQQMIRTIKGLLLTNLRLD